MLFTKGNIFIFTFVRPNVYIMKERLIEFLRSENKSSAQLAEEIGVQPSGISHILSGRNNPSLDFVLKMLEKYQFLSTDWLLFGKGQMYKDIKMQTLFDDENIINQSFESKPNQKEVDSTFKGSHDTDKDKLNYDVKGFSIDKVAAVKRIVWFYNDNSFDEYFPRH
jgi:transcriptional regulator with XRE-family HTH domain